jgi:phosphoglycerate dehydrogenase-like enzyme
MTPSSAPRSLTYQAVAKPSLRRRAGAPVAAAAPVRLKKVPTYRKGLSMVARNGQGGQMAAAMLGTGIMGSAMARRLVSAGFPVTVWDRSVSASAPSSRGRRRGRGVSPRSGPRC